MTINKHTPIHRLWVAYPQLIYQLVKRGSRYAYLINPASACTSIQFKH